MSLFGDIFGGITDFFGGGGDGGGSTGDLFSSAPVDTGGSLGDIIPMATQTVGDSFSLNPSDLISPVTNVPGLTTMTDMLNGFTDPVSQSLYSILQQTGTSPVAALTGQGGGTPAQTAGGSRTPSPAPGGVPKVTPTPQHVVTNPPTALGGAGGFGVPNIPGVTSGGGGSNILSSLLGNGGLLSMVPGIMSMLSAKDQQNLGPDATKMRAIADQNQGMIQSLSQESAAEKMGQLPGPAIASLEQSLAEQKAGLRERYNAMGMSGSSAEAADLAALNQQSESQRFQIGLNMANEGISQIQNLTGQDVGIYQNLVQEQTQRDQEYMQAMSDLMSGMAKAFTQGTTVNVGAPQGSNIAQGTQQPAPVDLSTLISSAPATDFLSQAIASLGTNNFDLSNIGNIDPSLFTGDFSFGLGQQAA